MSDYCVCGARVEDIMASANAELPAEDRSRPIWRHVPGSNTRCVEPQPTRNAGDRRLTQAAVEQMVDLTRHTRRASGEVETMQSQLAELSEEVGALRRVLDQPATVRKNTLIEVWDQLMNVGNLDGANTVRDMLRRDTARAAS